MTQTGKIGVSTENIFPIIKKFLYSEHDIFLRELVSNAVDATQKIKTLSSLGEFKGELGELKVKVSVDEAQKTISIEDNGIGMTKEEVEKYINQIAFSGAEEFLQKYKDQNAIIGHFGLGFYSSFMVAKNVEILTKSHKNDAKAVRWSCDGSEQYTIEEAEKEQRGTIITLFLDDESTEFASKERILGILNKYCKFLPVEIIFGKEQKWEDGKQIDTESDRVINSVKPLWTVSPSEIKEEQYNQFYHELYPFGEDPLFHIHLNVDYPFNLTGILYFPRIKNNFEFPKNKIQLYCNQVFVTDSVEGIVPEFLTLLHGVIDSPDIPLNVSRSYLQGDPNVKKISSHITKKVADRLQELFNKNREEYQSKWDDLKLFIQYGVVSEDKFAEKANGFILLKNVLNEYFTIEEYKEKIKENQTNKDGELICIYSSNIEKQHSAIESAKAKGYDVLIMDSPLESHFINWAESKNEKTRFVRVDSDTTENLIKRDKKEAIALSTSQQEMLKPIFEAVLPTDDKSHFSISFEAMNTEASPVMITQNEMMRRMKDMAAVGGSNSPYSFYANMPTGYNVVINGNHPLILNVFDKADSLSGKEVKQIDTEIEEVAKKINSLKEVIKDKKADELSPEEKELQESLTKESAKLKTEKSQLLRKDSKEIPLVGQLIDLALLSNGMLKGEAMTAFIKRSVDMIAEK